MKHTLERRKVTRSVPTRDNDARVLVAAFHGFVGGVGDGEDVRRALVDLAPLVLVHILLFVDVERAVRVHGHDHLPDVRVDARLFKPAKHGSRVIPNSFMYASLGSWGSFVHC